MRILYLWQLPVYGTISVGYNVKLKKPDPSDEAPAETEEDDEGVYEVVDSRHQVAHPVPLQTRFPLFVRMLKKQFKSSWQKNGSAWKYF